jgi:hypothetical protein
VSVTVSLMRRQTWVDVASMLAQHELACMGAAYGITATMISTFFGCDYAQDAERHVSCPPDTA